MTEFLTEWFSMLACFTTWIIGFAFGMFIRGCYGVRGRKIRCNEQIHRMEPRYDEGISDSRMEQILSHDFQSMYGDDKDDARQDMIKLAHDKRYVHDVCVDCGKVIERLVPNRLDLPGKVTA